MSFLLPTLYILGLYGSYIAGFMCLRTRSITFHLPRMTFLLVLMVAIPSTLQFFFPPILFLFQRDYTRFLDGDWWRLITPLFVQDGGVAGAVFNLVSLLLIGTIAEQLWDGKRVLVFFFVGGIVGELVGFVWQPVGAGNSIANFSLAASIAIACLSCGRSRAMLPAVLLALGADIVLVVLNDIHGAAALAGAVLALILLRWRPSEDRVR